jgi:glycine cleavage system H protein
MAGQTPDNLRYTREHEWVDVTVDGHARFGITDHAQDALGDIVFVTLPAVEVSDAAALDALLDAAGYRAFLEG